MRRVDDTDGLLRELKNQAEIVESIKGIEVCLTVREQAIVELGKLGDPTTTPAIVAMLGDRQPAVRVPAARVLAKMGGTEAEDGLLSALEDPDGAVRRWAARGVGSLGVSRGAPLLLPLLKDDYFDVRLSAARALVKLGDGEASSAMKQAVQAESWRKPSYKLRLGIAFLRLRVRTLWA